MLHPSYGLFSRTTCVNQQQKGKPFWILVKQEMMGWQWYQLDIWHIQIIFTSLQRDNHARTSAQFLQAGCPSCHKTNSVKALKAVTLYNKLFIFPAVPRQFSSTLHLVVVIIQQPRPS